MEFMLMNNGIRRFHQRKVEARILREMSDLQDKKKILEIGCGNGYGTYLINLLFKPAEIEAIDLDPRMIKRAKKNAKKTDLLNVNYQEASVTDLPFEDEAFDAVVDFGIIHHVRNWEDAIKECARVIKEGGQFIVSDVSIETWQAFIGRIYRHFSDHPYDSMYTVYEFVDSVKRNDFDIIHLRKKYDKFFPFFFVLAKKN